MAAELTKLKSVTILTKVYFIRSVKVTGRLIDKEDTMLQISAAATAQLAEYFKDRDVSPVRIFLNEGG
jgi:hypothetical protein